MFSGLGPFPPLPRSAAVSNTAHVVLTILTCGLWLPIWIISRLLPPSRCTLCGNLFKRTRYVWKGQGETHHLCTHCNQQVERRKSRAAWDDTDVRRGRKPADSPRRSGTGWKVLGVGCLAVVLGGGLLAVVGIGVAVYAQDQVRKELAEADRRWEAGERAEAAAVYRRLLGGGVALDRSRELVAYQRVIEYDVGRGEAGSARQLAERAADKGFDLHSDDPATTALLAEVRADRERRSADEQTKREAEAKRRQEERDAEAKRREEERANPPYRFLKAKREDKHLMELYVRSGELDVDKLRALCREKKGSNGAEVFYFLVVFDSEDNARFPSTPFTAEYGLEEQALRHIKAIYVHNKKNGFSELRYHNNGIWDTKPTREKP